MDADLQTSLSEDVSTTGNDANPVTTQSSSGERWSKLPKTRGRQPRDPNAQSVRFQCRNTDDLERHLKGYLEAPTGPAEHVTLEFHYPVSAAFMVYAADFRGKEESHPHGKQNGHLYGKLDRRAVSVIDALAQTEEPKDQMRRQKAIAKVCVEACEKADGFRYSFHNNWLSREDEACRFSYFCNDSTLNKGRAANEGAGTSGKKMRKPVYDCQGLIAIKFSNTKQSLEIHYKHIPVHKTYMERAPPPRRDSKRYRLLEVFNPESLPQKLSKRRKSEEENTPKVSRRRQTTEQSPTTETDTALSNVHENRLQPLVRFLDSASSHVDDEASSSQQNVLRNVDTNTFSTNAQVSEQAQPVVPRRKSRTKKDMPGIIAGSFQDGSIVWGEDNSQNQGLAQKSKKKDTNSRSREITEAASSGVPQSEFELLKAKLEEAEQRIKKLESEKSQTTQPWLGPGYPFPPPQYSYPYSPPSYPYPPQGYSQTPQPGPPPQQSAVQVVAQASHHSLTNPRAIQPNNTSAARQFVPYMQTAQNSTSDHRSQVLRPLSQAMSKPGNVTDSLTAPQIRLRKTDQSASSHMAQGQPEATNKMSK